MKMREIVVKSHAVRLWSITCLLVFFALAAAPAQACTLLNWSGGATGTVTANGKFYEGVCGAKFQLSGQNLLTDLSPADEKVYVASFYAFLGEMNLGVGDQLVIFSGDQGVGNPEVQLRIDRVGDAHRLALVAFDDGGASYATTPVSVNYGWNQLQLWWTAASAPGANDGTAYLRVDGVDKGGLTNLDNDLGAINEARLGRVGGNLSSPTRFFDVDLFDSRRVGSWIDAYKPFSDVTTFAAEIGTLFRTGITSGCSVGQYCPNAPITRAQMAVFILRSMLGSYHFPPALPPEGSSFADVTNQFPTWVEEFYLTGITGGCATNPLRYCPDAAVTRGQMAVFILRGIEGANYFPPPLPPEGSSFNDVTTFDTWIEELYRRGITGGCGNGNYCPNSPVTRGQMAAFIQRGFNLPLTAGQATNSQ